MFYGCIFFWIEYFSTCDDCGYISGWATSYGLYFSNDTVIQVTEGVDGLEDDGSSVNLSEELKIEADFTNMQRKTLTFYSGKDILKQHDELVVISQEKNEKWFPVVSFPGNRACVFYVHVSFD